MTQPLLLLLTLGPSQGKGLPHSSMFGLERSSLDGGRRQVGVPRRESWGALGWPGLAGLWILSSPGLTIG